MCGAYRLDLHKGLVQAELPTKPCPVNSAILVDLLNHSKGVGLEWGFRSVTK